MPASTVRVTAQVEWTVCKDNASGYWIAVSRPLKQTVSGETWRELNDSIAETIDLLFRDLLESDELESFLSDHGWKLAQRIPDNRRNLRFDVPWKLVQRQRANVEQEALC